MIYFASGSASRWQEQTWLHEHASQEEVGELAYAQLDRMNQLPTYLEQLN